MRIQFYNVPMQSSYQYQTKPQQVQRFGNTEPLDPDDQPQTNTPISPAEVEAFLRKLEGFDGVLLPEDVESLERLIREEFGDPDRTITVVSGVFSDGPHTVEKMTVREFLQRRLGERGDSSAN